MKNEPRLVDRPSADVLNDLRGFATRNWWFAKGLQQNGTQLTQEWLTRRAEQLAFKGVRALRRLVPPLANYWRGKYERTILNALCVVTGVADKQEKS